VLALASHITSEQIGTGFFQETPPERLFLECSHFCELVSQPAQLPRLARIAIQTALGRGGVAVLALPGDVLHQPAAHPTGQGALALRRGAVVPCDERVQALAERLNNAESVTLFCGAGVAGKLNSPIGHSLRGKKWI
jgi:pyruvate dehydrogenase (quinone)